MALDRWIALIILIICMAYGYAAFFTMDADLPPFMRHNPIWPSTFPKVLSVMAILTSLVILLGLEKHSGEAKVPDIDHTRLLEYNLAPALALLVLMVAYALLLRPAGFILSTSGFLILGAAILGERKFQYLIPIALLATGVVWYLVQGVLGIFLRPLPYFMG
ncbi:putative tricarboxylic transport membrane protein [Aliiruegeria haliotis]|uniref:Putative tricarboxylic transport membrane protein n=1 Tax=Aliiruegeria haliotis TaxID=1280846 RepID=A0A2T0RZS8_9RHOB|nr:tripartite tricarboxylate transporter TctB family protein [Aliiruegeria haliotis]PRY26691.1 putative tricarboxylic transport membrane protein [Aliiruegeria haliotis]